MKKVLFGIFAVVFSLPAMALTVSGTVLDNNDEPLVGATIYEPNSQRGITTDVDGNFSEAIDVDAGASLKISFVGCKEQTVKASDLVNKTIKLNCAEQLEAGKATDDFKSRDCNSDELNSANATAGKTARKDGENGIFCNPTACKCGYDLDKSDSKKHKCVKWEDGKKCTKNTKPKLPNNAKSANMVCENDVAVCKIESCDGVEFKLENNKCVKTSGDKCDVNDQNAKTAKLEKRGQNMVCVIRVCVKGYVPADDGLSCVLSEGDCTAEQLSALDENATKGELKKQKCTITECKPGLVPEDNKCVEISGACDTDDLPENATSGQIQFDATSQQEVCLVSGCVGGYKPSDDKLSCVVDEEEQADIDDAREKYEAAKANEQSLANRMLGAASMGSMGIGGMMVASSLAEKNADADAELDMAAYLATFKCDYGAGLNIRGGQVNVELPGAAELIPLYSEYVTLANDVKARKEQLGLKSGIESEKILDSATTGLYDDVGVGISSGAYASLARALQNPDGADAKMWAEQKEKSAQNLKTGAITAGVGAVIGIAGNAVNKGIIKKREKSKPEAAKKLEEEIADISPAKATCPAQARGTYPNCICNSNKEYNRNANECRECTGGRKSEVKDGLQQCVCPSENQEWDATTEECIEADAAVTCNADAGEQLQNGQCVTVTPNPAEDEQQQTDEKFDVVLPITTLFEVGKSTLRAEAKQRLDNFIFNFISGGVTECSDFEVAGYADPSGGKSRNLTLSKERATAVHDYFMSKSDFKALLGKSSTGVVGYGESHCTCGVLVVGVPTDKQSDDDYKYCVGKSDTAVVPDGVPFAPCRRVKISMTCKGGN